MPRHEISPHVLAFMTEHIRSLDHLQLLTAVMLSGERWWDKTTVARELGMTVHTARRALDHLAAHNLLDIRIAEDIRYQFRPGTDELRRAAQAFAEAYRRRPLPLLEIASGGARRRIRDIAGALKGRDADR